MTQLLPTKCLFYNSKTQIIFKKEPVFISPRLCTFSLTFLWQMVRQFECYRWHLFVLVKAQSFGYNIHPLIHILASEIDLLSLLHRNTSNGLWETKSQHYLSCLLLIDYGYLQVCYISSCSVLEIKSERNFGNQAAPVFW